MLKKEYELPVILLFSILLIGGVNAYYNGSSNDLGLFNLGRSYFSFPIIGSAVSDAGQSDVKLTTLTVEPKFVNPGDELTVTIDPKGDYNNRVLVYKAGSVELVTSFSVCPPRKAICDTRKFVFTVPPLWSEEHFLKLYIYDEADYIESNVFTVAGKSSKCKQTDISTKELADCFRLYGAGDVPNTEINIAADKWKRGA